jgi:hypothetical protein
VLELSRSKAAQFSAKLLLDQPDDEGIVTNRETNGVCRNGFQRMKSDGPFTATLWGWSRCASYAYPGGVALRKLVPTPLPTIR